MLLKLFRFSKYDTDWSGKARPRAQPFSEELWSRSQATVTGFRGK
ncbi:MAG TPA: hypothetical protein PKD79_00905 [Candidatus Doudnabacteria bacterium]|nr:hypothetical protein [Candidatus Doudnabacteria bacterium]